MAWTGWWRCKTWLDSADILKAEPAEFADRLRVRSGVWRKRRTRVFSSSNLGGNPYSVNWGTLEEDPFGEEDQVLRLAHIISEMTLGHPNGVVGEELGYGVQGPGERPWPK